MVGSEIRSLEQIEYFRPHNVKFDKVTIIDCFDSFTHNLVHEFLKLGAPVVVIRDNSSFDQILDSIGSYLVISPGPGRPSNTELAPKVINNFLGDIPILGVCLGMQLLNEIFGGKTIPANKIIHGKTSTIYHDESGIFQGIDNPTAVARYHSLQVEIINETIEIQSSIDDTPMAMRMDNQFVAVQFHPESFMTPKGSDMLLNFLEGTW